MNALILAAGFGSRLKSITNNQPKALVKIKGNPILDIVIKKLNKLKLNKIIINSHYQSDKIIEFLKKNKYKINPIVIYEPEILGTGGAILNAKQQLIGDNCLIYNVDIITKFDLNILLEAKFCEKTVAVVLTNNIKCENYLNEDRNKNIVGHNQKIKDTTHKNFCGIYLITKYFWDFVDQVSPPKKFSTIAIFKNAIKNGYKIQSITTSNQCYDIGTIKVFNKVNNKDFKL